MKVTNKKVQQLIEEGVLYAPMDGNHGEKHPKTSDYVEKGVPFILVPDLTDGIVDLDNCNFISEEQAKTLRKGISKTGDVLFTHKATIGKVALVDTKEYDYIILTPQVTYYRIKNDKVLCNEYLYYYFQSPTFQNTFKMFASSGGTRDYLGIVAQQKLPIIYPDIIVQKDIVSVLKSYDKLIRNNNSRIKILEKMAENLYKEWFVRFRFPGHEKAEFENGLPNGWRTETASNVVDVMSGGTPKTEREDFYGGDIPFYTPKDADDSIFVYSTITYITEEGLAHCNSQYYPVNTLMITARGTVGKLSLLAVSMAMNQSCFALKFKDNNHPYYLYYSIKNEVSKLKKMASGGVFDTIVVKTFDHIKITVPSEEMLFAFDKVVTPLLEQIQHLQRQSNLLSRQRDLLLPRLMSGKLEVKV